MKGETPQGRFKGFERFERFEGFEGFERLRGVKRGSEGDGGVCSQSMPTPDVANNRQMTTSHDIGS